MRLSTVFELLLIFLFLAFAASRTIHPKKGVKGVVKQTQNRYCQCTNLMCNCCRDFSLPVVSIKGPGCATVAYLNEDAMRLTMTFGDKVLRNITLAGKRPNPVCMPLPGGVSKFCGRVYGITRDGDHFKACLALELRSLEDLEAALRVSCFRFGPEGVKLEPGRPVPVVPTDEDEDDDDDDDYGFSDDDDDDDFGLSDDDDDDDDDNDDDDDDEDETENDVDSGDADYTAFSALSDEFLGGFFGSSNNKKPIKPSSKPSAIPSIAQSQSISKDKPAKTTVSKVTFATAKPMIKKTTTTTTTKVPKRETTTANMEVTQTKTKPEEITSTQNYAETFIKNHTDHSQTNTQINESSTQMIGYTAIPAEDSEKYSDEEEEYGSTESSSEDSTETSESIDSENKDNNSIASKILDDEEEGDERTFPSNRGHNLTPAETEELFPGLTALIRPPSHISFSFPPVRSARTHRRMRLPPIQN